MKTARCFLCSSWLLAALAGCGGGGDSAAPPPAADAPPTSGSYQWVLTAEGATSQLKYGLSLLHPLAAGTEYVLEAASEAVTDAKVVESGTVDVANRSVLGLQPHTLVYVVGGDVRRTPLVANGQLPRTQVQRAVSTSACRFVLDAVHHAAPDQSRFIVSTAGADGACDSADDGRAEVRLQSAAPGIALKPLVGAAPLAPLRDLATLAPRAWVYPTEVAVWTPAGETRFGFRASANAVQRVVSATDRDLLVESSSGLALLDFAGGDTFTDTQLPGVAASGWAPLGHDRQYHYVYRNTGDSSGAWQVLRVARGIAPAATVLASGPGQITVASLGADRIYLTVFSGAGNQLLRLAKAVPGAAPDTLESTAADTLSTVVTSGSNVHQLWRVTGVGSSTPSYTVQMIDEGGVALYSSSSGGFPLLLAGAQSLRLDASENRTVFVFADGYGARAFSGAQLVTYDTVARTARVSGRLPGSAAFGDDFVFASSNGGSTGFMTGFAARSINGVVQGSGAQVFSFDAATASSLKTATARQP